MSYKVTEAPQQRKTLQSRGIKTSPPIWMDQKARRDQKLWENQDKNLWIVENKLYDLNKFIDKHPGGSSWISLTKGQDITEHFVVHHLNESKAREVLKKYEVGECKKKVVRFSFQQNGFYRTVKRKVLEKYSIQEIQNQNPSKINAFIILFIWLALLVATVTFKSYILAALCSIPMVGLVGVGHNFVHHKDNYYKYFFNIVGFTHTQWRIMHCISHHVYPNTQLDYEIAAFEPIGFYLRTMPENKFIFQFALELLFIFIQPINMILKLFILPIIKFRKPDLWYGFPFLILGFIYLNSDTFGEAIKLYLAIYCTYGFFLMKSLFCGHRLQELWTEGSDKIEDYGEHTVLATADTDTWIHGIFSYMLLAGFNVHVVHHFFPSADHHILPKLREILLEVCQERGVKYTQKTRWECMKSLNKGFTNRIAFANK